MKHMRLTKEHAIPGVRRSIGLVSGNPTHNNPTPMIIDPHKTIPLPREVPPTVQRFSMSNPHQPAVSQLIEYFFTCDPIAGYAIDCSDKSVSVTVVRSTQCKMRRVKNVIAIALQNCPCGTQWPGFLPLDLTKHASWIKAIKRLAGLIEDTLKDKLGVKKRTKLTPTKVYNSIPLFELEHRALTSLLMSHKHLPPGTPERVLHWFHKTFTIADEKKAANKKAAMLLANVSNQVVLSVTP